MSDETGASRADAQAQTAVLPSSLMAPDISALFGLDLSDVGYDPPRALTSVAKRVLDIVGAALLLVVFSPIWLIASVIIKATSRGPVLFRQERLGVAGRRFTLYKFRTMQDGVPDDAHREYVARYIRPASGRPVSEPAKVFKLTRDARVTGVGRILRKLSLDEVPQLLNVLRGDMSLVGPRPPLAYEVVQYDAWQVERLSVRPGITGLWQVSGRNRLTHAEMCRLDLEYIRNWSLGRDLAIVARTPWVMLVDGGGAA